MKPAIVTKYLPGSINGKHPPGPRIIARGGGKMVRLEIRSKRDDPLCLYQNTLEYHARAAGLLRMKLGLRGALIAGPTKDGFAFVFANQRSVA